MQELALNEYDLVNGGLFEMLLVDVIIFGYGVYNDYQAAKAAGWKI